jgi:tryptophan-rich sensory protein
MPVSCAILISLGICLIAALLEGLFAGKNVKSVLGKLQTPSFAPPLWVWAIIGVCYYATCFFILYRIFRHDSTVSVKTAALILLLIIMAVNAFWNYVFFRLENLFYSFVLSILYSLVAVALFFCLLRFDTIAALAQVPYLLYLIYAFRWGYGLLKLNPK